MAETTRYREIAADLQRKIESGELGPGARLPSDAELGKTYHASRNTVREAVKNLVTRGFVEKPSGRLQSNNLLELLRGNVAVCLALHVHNGAAPIVNPC